MDTRLGHIGNHRADHPAKSTLWCNLTIQAVVRYRRQILAIG